MTAAQDSMIDRLTATLVGSRTQFPAEVSDAFDADRAALDAAGVPDDVAAVGTTLPDAGVLTVDGSTTRLSDELGGRTAVLVFYRGAWCPFCNIALRAYQQELVPALEERGVALVALSPQKPDGSLSTAEADELTFSVLSDAGNAVARSLGILAPTNPDALAAQRKLGLDVTEVNADGTADLPFPTVVVVDSSRTVRFIDVHPNYTSRTEPAQILAALDAITDR
ncbi:peroxiredoxin-like family protein [Williamsia serinedens]|uniref:thioredoxin-dependent peroxiredoxin n=1 Tax=Williamsia serinedens TaxID=391736 RepID=A0ABT1GYH4_9NOCA|nr:peroxiredoxin-like family protein [Williamsia serinedens]MCP2160039.1 Peroxiredoxin [Williamsia serinedens]